MTQINIINNFFQKIDQFGINYAILHHIENIYSQNDDIDMIIDCSKNNFLNFLESWRKKNNCFLGKYYSIDKDIFRFDIFYFEGNKLNKIELDCVCGGIGKDLLEINSYELLKNRIEVFIGKYKFYKVSDIDEIEYYIKKKAYKNADITTYMEYLQKLDSTITEEAIYEKYQSWKNYFKSKKYRVKYYVNKVQLLVKRISEQPILSICFLGPDGSGKSTIIDEVEQSQLFINNYYFHLKPIKIKSSSANNEMVENPHKYSSYSKLKSYIKLLYFIYQYNMGWLKNIVPMKIKSSLVIFDRYFDDLLVDNKRYRYGGNMIMVKLARIFIPKPELYFILTTDAKVIYERKQEVPFEELERQIVAYSALADGNRYFQIDVNRSPEEISKEIVTIMMEKMNERY